MLRNENSGGDFVVPGCCQSLQRAVFHVSRQRELEAHGYGVDVPNRTLGRHFPDTDWQLLFRFNPATVGVQ